MVPDEITGIASVDDISSDLGVMKIKISRKFRRTVLVHVSSETDVKEAERLYRNDPNVVYARADYLAFFSAVSND
ncbi:MAG: hypothetical protein GF417_10395 [Candidatus Latescibacteria bacterium]|nr:hypothetical protein [Candidatus Latescibacterota bacterium]